MRVKSIGLKHSRIATPDRFMLRLHRDTAAVILPVLPSMCPLLAHLNLCGSIEAHTAVSASSAAICATRNLLTLAINTALSGTALRHLGNMRNLQTLETGWDSSMVADDRGFDSILSIPSGSLFPALQKLVFFTSSLDTCTKFIMSIQSRKLIALSLGVDSSRSIDLSLLFNLLKFEDNLLLTHISIRNQPRIHAVHLMTAPIYNPYITGVTLQPLFARSNLTILDINLLHCSFDLDDAVLLMMATSWPALQTLHLGHTFGWRRDSNITLDGLVALVTYCAELQSLGIVLDATVDPAPLNDDGPINDKITCLHLGDSKPSIEPFPSHIAQFLSDLFPRLTKIHVLQTDGPLNAAWHAVEEMILELGEYGEIAEVADM
jgi:hypothetical protein